MRRVTDFMAPSGEYVNGGEGYVPPMTSDTQHNLVAGRDSSGAHPASAITNIPAGNIVATDVQAAINELETEKVPWVSGSIVFDKASGKGIKVDQSTPVFPWADIIGKIEPKTTGAGTPALTAIQGNIHDYAFVLNDVADLVFHIPHDHVPGSDIYIHVHWSHNGTAITGNVVFTHYSTYAKGHNQAIFPAEVTNTITYNTVNLATTPRYLHRVDEIQLSTAGGSASMLNTTNIEPDGLVLMRVKVTTLPTITAGSLFVHFIDIHYQSTGIGTKGKTPNFYS